MKKILTSVLFTLIIGVNAQVIIGDAVGTPGSKTSVLLDFAANQDKGIIVPYVRTLPTTLPTRVEGTILLDASVATNARMKLYNANTDPGTNGWLDLSGQDADVSGALISQPTGVVETSSKAIIGAVSSNADGVLVLESTTKAMILPIVDDVQNILSPSPGMMVYVKGVTPNFKKRLAVFNGAKWSFWKP